MKRYILKLAVILSFLIIPAFAVLADPPSDAPPPGPGGTGGGTPVGAPIDGGMAILLALGFGYGGWKLYKFRKQNLHDTLPE
jgi:uncharacterized protein HemX